MHQPGLMLHQLAPQVKMNTRSTSRTPEAGGNEQHGQNEDRMNAARAIVDMATPTVPTPTPTVPPSPTVETPTVEPATVETTPIPTIPYSLPRLSDNELVQPFGDTCRERCL